MATLSSRRSCDGLLPLTLFSSLGTSGLNSSVGEDGMKKKHTHTERGKKRMSARQKVAKHDFIINSSS